MAHHEQRALEINLIDSWKRLNYGELSAIPKPISHSFRIFPIPHDYLIESVMDAIGEEQLRLHETLYAVSQDEQRFIGIIDLRSREVPDTEKSWVIAVTNANDGKYGVSIYGGCRIFASNALAFHEELCVIGGHSEQVLTNLPVIVHKAINNLHGHWNVNDHRADCYKEHSLTRKEAHDIICQAISSDIVAGREIATLLDTYHNSIPEFRPRNLWSLFNCIVINLNTLKVERTIERTIQLHQFLDSVAAFKIKASKFIQSNLPLC